jgi:MOSC domain-containing protein YiiM
MSSTIVGKVLDLFVSLEGQRIRRSKSIIELDKQGIVGDKFYAKDLERSVLLTTIESYGLAMRNDIHMSYGSLGENILIDFNPYRLMIGSRIKIGSVLFEITQNCTICNHLSSIDTQLPKLLKDDRGIFIKVVEVGFIEKGDKIYLL